MVGLLASVETAWNNEWESLQTTKHLLLALHAQLSGWADNHDNSAIFSFVHQLFLDNSVDDWNEVCQSLAASSAGLHDRIAHI